MDVVDVYYVGGFGVMGWVPASEYDQAHPDPLADATGEIVQHMNTDHKDALTLLARVFAGIESQEACLLYTSGSRWTAPSGSGPPWAHRRKTRP